MREPLLHALQHAMGLDDYGRGTHYRNHYATGPDCDTWALMEQATADGLVRRSGPSDIYGGSTSYCFTVTDAGKKYVREHSPKPPKQLTAGQKRYREWLNVGDCWPDWTFGDWLKNRKRLEQERREAGE